MRNSFSHSRTSGRLDASLDVVPPCVSMRDVYDTLADPCESRHAWNGARDQAAEACASCPLLATCLYRAVVEGDVEGYVACTLPQERHEIRSRLGITVSAVDTDRLAGLRPTDSVPGPHDVLAARRAYPSDTFAQLADRLGCSVSTVKRRVREASSEGARPSRTAVPSVDAVLDVFDEVVGNAPTHVVASRVRRRHVSSGQGRPRRGACEWYSAPSPHRSTVTPASDTV